MKLSLFLVLSLMAASVQATESNRFYVATNGNDVWSGTRPVPNPRKTDVPFATLSHAVAASRDVHRPVTIEVRGGTHSDKPLLLGPQDSGLTVAAYRNEKPVISGGRRITGWRPATNQLWTAEATGDFRELWVNGQRRVCARYPNKGYLSVAEVQDAPVGDSLLNGQTRFRFRDGDLKAWASVTNAEVVVMSLWIESRLPVVSVDEKERLVTFGKRSVFKFTIGDLYWIENVFEALNAPVNGIWIAPPGRLYYWPMPCEDMGKAEVIAPGTGKAARLENVEKVTFHGLTFAHTEWSLPKEASGFVQAAFGVPGSVYGDGVRQCAFEDRRFMHVGSYALELARGCQSNRVVRCEMTDLGAGGIKIGEPSAATRRRNRRSATR